jgi:hypothetical protein
MRKHYRIPINDKHLSENWEGAGYHRRGIYPSWVCIFIIDNVYPQYRLSQNRHLPSKAIPVFRLIGRQVVPC